MNTTKKITVTILCVLLCACAKRAVIGGSSEVSARRPGVIEIERSGVSSGGRRIVPVDVANLYLQALMAHHSGHYQQSLSKLTAVLNLDQTFSEAYWARGEVYYDLEKYDLAARNYQLALQYEPQMVDAALQLARIYMLQNKYKKVNEQLTYVLDIDSSQTIALALKEISSQKAGDFYLQKSRELKQAGNRPKAVIALKYALENNPKLYPAWLELGRIQQERGDTALALESYEKALDIKQDFPVVWTEMGKLYMQSATYDRARQAFQHSLVLNPDQPEVQALLSKAQNSFYRMMELPEEYLTISSGKEINRAQLAAVLAVNLRDLPPSAQASSEKALIIPDIEGHWAQKFIIFSVKRQWMQSYPNHSFLPSQAVSRGELAAILDNIIASQPVPKHVKALDKPIIFTDISPENQYYQAVMRTSSVGLLAPYQKQEGTFLPDKSVNGVEALEIVDRLVEYLNLR